MDGKIVTKGCNGIKVNDKKVVKERSYILIFKYDNQTFLIFFYFQPFILY